MTEGNPLLCQSWYSVFVSHVHRVAGREYAAVHKSNRTESIKASA
jgi:hypothetical protein